MIDAVFPDLGGHRANADLPDAVILELYTGASAVLPEPPGDGWLRVNAVSTLDGSASANGVSGPMGGPDDLRVFDLLRRVADVVLVGAGTVREEGYGPMRLSRADVVWRRDHGLPDHPALALVSGSLSLDPDAPMFVDAPSRPVILTTADAPAGRRAALASVADVVVCGASRADPAAVRAELVRRGLRRIHCEGGPTLLGAFIEADLIDELCLTLDPTLEGGVGGRIARGGGGLRRMQLAHILRGSGGTLLTRFVRDR